MNRSRTGATMFLKPTYKETLVPKTAEPMFPAAFAAMIFFNALSDYQSGSVFRHHADYTKRFQTF